MAKPPSARCWLKVSDGEEEDSDEDKPEPTWEPGKEMKVTKGMTYTANRHFVAAQNFWYDEENRISIVLACAKRTA